MRLTKRYDNGIIMTENAWLRDVLKKLAAYEDTGLEPDDIRENIGLLSPICIGCDGKTADGKRTEKCTYVDDDFRKCLERSVHLSELAHAEEQGLLVRLPCKVGDTVYRIVRHRVDVSGYRMEWEWETMVEAVRFHIGMTDAIGKTIFLTEKKPKLRC